MCDASAARDVQNGLRGTAACASARGLRISTSTDAGSAHTSTSCRRFDAYASRRYHDSIICMPSPAFCKLSATPNAETKHTFRQVEGRAACRQRSDRCRPSQGSSAHSKDDGIVRFGAPYSTRRTDSSRIGPSNESSLQNPLREARTKGPMRGCRRTHPLRMRTNSPQSAVRAGYSDSKGARRPQKRKDDAHHGITLICQKIVRFGRITQSARSASVPRISGNGGAKSLTTHTKTEDSMRWR